LFPIEVEHEISVIFINEGIPNGFVPYLSFSDFDRSTFQKEKRIECEIGQLTALSRANALLPYMIALKLNRVSTSMQAGVILMNQQIRLPIFPNSVSYSALFGRDRNDGVSAILSRPEAKRRLFFSYGRIALFEGLKILGVRPGVNFLVPAYVCQSAVEPFQRLGIEVRFYDVNAELHPNIDDLKAKVDGGTKGIMVINYFGFPQPLQEVKAICQAFGLFLIEDNAHGFFSLDGPRLLGTRGDIGIACIWKYLPIANGAILYINSQSLPESMAEIVEQRSKQTSDAFLVDKASLFFILSSLRDHLEFRYPFLLRYLRSRKAKALLSRQANYETGGGKYETVLSKFALRMARRMDTQHVIQERRTNYHFWLGYFSGKKGIRFAFDKLAEGVTPAYFPLVVDNADELIQKMTETGLYARTWPPFPREVENNPDYPVANFLGRRLVILPVHQDVDRDRLKRALHQAD
jgi:dTDP-4-amino-4,6-dideoxygalactose transaminase